MFSSLSQRVVWLFFRMALIGPPIYRASLASLAWSNLPKHHIGNSQLLKLLLTVRFILLLIDHKSRSENLCFTIHKFFLVGLVCVLFFHDLLEVSHTLLVNDMNSCICDKIASTVFRLDLGKPDLV